MQVLNVERDITKAKAAGTADDLIYKNITGLEVNGKATDGDVNDDADGDNSGDDDDDVDEDEGQCYAIYRRANWFRCVAQSCAFRGRWDLKSNMCSHDRRT